MQRADFPVYHCLGPFQPVPVLRVDYLQRLPVTLNIKTKSPWQGLTLSHLLYFSLPGTWLSFILPSCHTHLSVSPAGHDLPFHTASEQTAPSARKYLPTFSAWLTSINPSGLCWSATSLGKPSLIPCCKVSLHWAPLLCCTYII